MEKQPQTKNVTILLLSAGLVISVITLFILSRKQTKSMKEDNSSFSLENIHFSDSIYTLSPGIGSKPEDEAVSNVAAYRQVHPASQGYGVYYDSSDISYYATEIFPKLVAEQIKDMKARGKMYDETKYTWKIGFYWLLNKDSKGIKRYDYCMVPILVNENNSSDMYEYFLSGDQQYNHNPTIQLRRRGVSIKMDSDSTSNGNIFNTGTMFP